MICKRCGANYEESDHFCRACGKRFRAQKNVLETNVPDTVSLTETESAADSKKTFSTRKKLVLLTCFGTLLLITAFILIFLPNLKQAFMSPAAYYLECEATEIKNLSNNAGELLNTFYNHQAKKVDAHVTFETTGDEYAALKPLLENLQINATYQSNAKDRTALSLTADYNGDVFCNVLANLVGEELCLRFPEMTKGEVTAKFASVLQNALKSSDDSIQSLTGYSRQELTNWIASFLRPILMDALNESEQTLDITVIDGMEVSSVTFSLSEKQAKQILHDISASLRADEKLPTILKNASAFFTTSAEFKRDFIAEFHLAELSEEDLSDVPLFVSLADALNRIDTAKAPSLLHLVLSAPEETEIRAYLDRLADSVFNKAETLSLPNGIQLTAYYQKTQLIGRSLKCGSTTIFECFRYRRDNELTLDLNLESNGAIYHFSHVDTSNGTRSNHQISLTRLAADVEGENPKTTEENLFLLELNFDKNATVSGIRVFLGEAKLSIGDTVYTLVHSIRDDSTTHLHFEKKQLSKNVILSRFVMRGDLEFSSAVDAEEIQVSGTSNFGKGEFKELVLNLKRKLQDSNVFELYFGEGSLDRFRSDEEKRLMEAGDNCLTDNNQETPPEEMKNNS